MSPATDGGNQAWSPGRSRISRKTIAQGRPDDPPVPVVLPRAFLLHADHGCGGHPAFPAPFDFEGGEFPKARTFRAARMKTRVSNHVAAHPSRRRYAPPQDVVVTSGTKSDPRGEERGKAARLEP
jgi:hypothetical protein